MKKEVKLQELNDIEEREYMLEMIKELKYSSKIYTVEELTRMLNPYDQQALPKLDDFINKNAHIPKEKIIKELEDRKFITTYKNFPYYAYSRDKPYFAHRHHTYNCITPILKNGRLVSFEEAIVINRIVEGKLQEYFDQQLGKNEKGENYGNI